jgi:hypothetical protein
MGETMNKTNIAQKLRVHGESGSSRRTSLNYHDSASNKEDDDDAEEKLLKMMEMKTK